MPNNPMLEDDGEEELLLPDLGSFTGSELAMPELIMPDIASSEPVETESPVTSGTSWDSVPSEEDIFGVGARELIASEDRITIDESPSALIKEESSYSTGELVEEKPKEEFDPLADLLSGLELGTDDSGLSISSSPIERFQSMLDGTEDDDDYDEYAERFIDLDKVVGKAIEVGASDIHISPQDSIAFTVLGQIYRYSEFGEIESDMTVKLQQDIISNVLEQEFVETLELDTSYVVKTGKYKGRRLRLSIGKSGGDVFMVFRVIADKMPTPTELGIPQQMQDWIKLPAGLILVNGPTGSGKSTTLSSLIQEMQFTRRDKIITIEKPIEFQYGVKEGQLAFITQREVGRDARNFTSALTSAMRQAPNIILVGEVRNREEIDELLRAAETGHLAISTLHTTSCPATINRIRSMYEGDEQLRVLATLADNLRGLMTQTLVKSPDGSKRTAVREVLQINRELKGYILAGDTVAMRQYQEKHGITMEHELVKAYQRGDASLESARSKAPDPFFFDELLDS